ncbi:hypothetical protein [Hydrogenimonas cancrithermarum]|uniref:Uncharacterized protein n=1 Tax=Hydrogenimonas cancrithermarum TaxID=2993563 RepID=A0ABM8FHI9_9BACT|nr:hypothetical protein [Hydrogenimonas cancrithermarum]BDY11763.1 hypothetical protein HCR_00750 [Hydrogenimonas cancrithermarum]
MEKCDNRVIVSGLDIPFWDLVWFMVKLALASIPALFIIYLIFAFLGMIFGGFFHMIAMPPPLP